MNKDIVNNQLKIIIEHRDAALESLINKLTDMQGYIKNGEVDNFDELLKNCWENLTAIDCRQAQIVTLKEILALQEILAQMESGNE